LVNHISLSLQSACKKAKVLLDISPLINQVFQKDFEKKLGRIANTFTFAIRNKKSGSS